MATYTLTLTPAINRAVSATTLTGVATTDERIPKDWSVEGALDEINASKVSVQRTGYIAIPKGTDPTKTAKTYEVGDQGTTPGLITQTSMLDAAVGMTGYPGVTIS